MFAVISHGGKQYNVEPGKLVNLEKIEGDVGSPVEIQDILMISGDNGIAVGNPYVSNAKVVGEIVKQFRDEKILILKKKRRKHYRRRAGHRQYLTSVLIKSINI